MRTSIDPLRYGVGLVTVRRLSSAASMGYNAWLAAKAGCVGVTITNGPALITPPEGRVEIVGNQGHAIASPGPTVLSCTTQH